jgi:hypothetical protein
VQWRRVELNGFMSSVAEWCRVELNGVVSSEMESSLIPALAAFDSVQSASSVWQSAV